MDGLCPNISELAIGPEILIPGGLAPEVGMCWRDMWHVAGAHSNPTSRFSPEKRRWSSFQRELSQEGQIRLYNGLYGGGVKGRSTRGFAPDGAHSGQLRRVRATGVRCLAAVEGARAL